MRWPRWRFFRAIERSPSVAAADGAFGAFANGTAGVTGRSADAPTLALGPFTDGACTKGACTGDAA